MLLVGLFEVETAGRRDRSIGVTGSRVRECRFWVRVPRSLCLRVRSACVRSAAWGVMRAECGESLGSEAINPAPSTTAPARGTLHAATRNVARTPIPERQPRNPRNTRTRVSVLGSNSAHAHIPSWQGGGAGPLCSLQPHRSGPRTFLQFATRGSWTRPQRTEDREANILSQGGLIAGISQAEAGETSPARSSMPAGAM
jgi:hypothetical protein